jgi:hypothetical protein
VNKSLKPLHKYILLLLFLNVLLLSAGYFLVYVSGLKIQLGEIVVLSTSFSIIAAITILIFLRGQSKEPDSQTLHSMLSVSIKFLLEMVLALVWFIVAKKTSFTSVLIFFVLYLTLTLFSIWIILKTLKNKAL